LVPPEPDPKAYRANVGLALFHGDGRVLIARRIDTPDPYAWQMPQGGIDKGETPRDAAYRELEEEIGVRAALATLLEETDDWLYYDFPEHLQRKDGPYGKHLGQRQKWFAFRFGGTDADVRLDRHTPEFSDWRWAPLAETPRLIVPFKRPVYEAVAVRFARHAQPPAMGA
jgi:putative (di)nucleoside polyphosphate hydrolase